MLLQWVSLDRIHWTLTQGLHIQQNLCGFDFSCNWNNGHCSCSKFFLEFVTINMRCLCDYWKNSVNIHILVVFICICGLQFTCRVGQRNGHGFPSASVFWAGSPEVCLHQAVSPVWTAVWLCLWMWSKWRKYGLAVCHWCSSYSNAEQSLQMFHKEHYQEPTTK